MTVSTRPFAVRGQLAIDGSLHPGVVIVEEGVISDVRLGDRHLSLPETVIDSEIVSPGFIDLQVNGGFGVEVDADPDSFRHLSAQLPATGVTTWLPTVISSRPETYGPIFAAFHAATGCPGAEPLGFHLEGPFLSLEKKGAHDPSIISEANDTLIDTWLQESSVLLVTVAPERSGGKERIRRLRERDIVISLGHTNATYEDFLAGAEAGATMATHLYNAMSPFGHRAPGVIGAVLLDDRLTAGLIADGIHSHRASLELAFLCKGARGIALVSDMMAAAGMPTGVYPLGGQDVTTDGFSARLPDGTLAGSLLTMDQAIRNMVDWEICSAAQAIQMATETPARLLGLSDRGQLQPGTRADITLLDEALMVQQVFIHGNPSTAG